MRAEHSLRSIAWRTTREERHIHLGRNADAVRRNGWDFRARQFFGGTFTAPMLFNLLDDAKNLGYVTVRGGEYRGMIPAGLNTLVLLSGSFSDTSNLAPYLADSLGLIPDGTSGDGTGDGMFHVGDLAISSKQTSVELDPANGLQQLSAETY